MECIAFTLDSARKHIFKCPHFEFYQVRKPLQRKKFQNHTPSHTIHNELLTLALFPNMLHAVGGWITRSYHIITEAHTVHSVADNNKSVINSLASTSINLRPHATHVTAQSRINICPICFFTNSLFLLTHLLHTALFAWEIMA